MTLETAVRTDRLIMLSFAGFHRLTLFDAGLPRS